MYKEVHLSSKIPRVKRTARNSLYKITRPELSKLRSKLTSNKDMLRLMRIIDYHELIKRELKIRPIYECR